MRSFRFDELPMQKQAFITLNKTIIFKNVGLHGIVSPFLFELTELRNPEINL